MQTQQMKDVFLRVLDRYKHLPCLWDKTHIDYSDRNIRQEAQNILLEIYKEWEPNASIKTLTKKILNCRTNYKKELKKVKQSAHKSEPYVPTLWYFDALSFLGDLWNDRFHNADESDAFETEYLMSASEEESDSDGQFSVTPPVKLRRLSKTEQIPDENTAERKKKLTEMAIRRKIRPEIAPEPEIKRENAPERKMRHENPPEPQMRDEDYEIIGKFVGIQLRGLASKQLVIAQKLISDAIYYGKLGMLNENSCIALQSEVTAIESPSAFPYHFVATNADQTPHLVSSSSAQRRRVTDSPQRTLQSIDPLVKDESSSKNSD